jgi:hypothetical protein
MTVPDRIGGHRRRPDSGIAGLVHVEEVHRSGRYSGAWGKTIPESRYGLCSLLERPMLRASRVSLDPPSDPRRPARLDRRPDTRGPAHDTQDSARRKGRPSGATTA